MVEDIKEFDKWNEKKKEIHNHESNLFYHEREIWWCSLGVNVGSEQDGTGKNFDRPVVIIKGFNRDVFFAVALTGRKKVGKYHFYLGKIEDHDASAILSQIRLIDVKRLVRKIGTLEEKLFLKLKNALRALLFG